MLFGRVSVYGFPFTLMHHLTLCFEAVHKKRTNIGLDPTRASLAGLVDLEPLRARRVELVARRTLTCGHIGHDRACVVRPL